MVKLSIIIPYYNTYREMVKLLDNLCSQTRKGVEILIINNWDREKFEEYPVTTLFCESNGTASKPRNVGLDYANGKFITFVDSDDNVSYHYIDKILHQIETCEFDYCFFSWKFMKLNRSVVIWDKPPKWNTSIWNCIYKRDIIGDIRFNEKKKIAEDNEFNEKVRKGVKANIVDILYYYNDSRTGSLTDLYGAKE